MDLYTAVLGGEKVIDTLEGKVKLKIKPETQNGTKVRLKGKGFPVYKKEGQFGDLIITYSVKIPTNLTDRQKELFKVSMPFIICWKGWKSCEGKSVRSGTSLLSLREKALWRIGEKIVSCVEILRSRWFRPEPLYHINRAFIKGGQSVCSGPDKGSVFLCLPVLIQPG